MSGQERTEEATPRRRARASAQGRSAHSAAAGAAASLLFAALPFTMLLTSVGWLAQLRNAAQAAAHASAAANAAQLLRTIGKAWDGPAVFILFAASLASAAAALAAAALCGSLRFAPLALRPDLQRLSWAAGAKRIVSIDGARQAIIAAVFVAALFWSAARASEPLVRSSRTTISLPSSAFVMLIAVRELWWQACVAAVVIAGLDVAWSRRRLALSLRMTPREVRDERAELEGRPEFKARRRSIAVRRTRGLRLRAIARATAIVTNPTRLAVALRYHPPAIDVPIVVARGANLAAAAVRAAAESYDIPIVESRELARALFHRVDIDEPIPEEWYAAVAAIFAWIIRTRGALRGADV